MSQLTSKLTYQVNLLKSLEIKNYYSPIFSTNNNLFWRILLIEADACYYGLYLQPVASPDEITWRERSKLTFNIFAREIRNDYQTIELYNRSFVVHPSTHIDNGSGYHYAIRKCLLRNGELIIGAIFDNVEYNESDISKTHCPEPIPKELIDAWKDQLFNFQLADVEFDVQDEKFYACSSILSKRSEYFAKLLSSHLPESNHTSNYPNNSTCQIGYRIKFLDYDPFIISVMLEYLYTNQIKWTNKEDKSITKDLFFIADQFILLDLRERAKIRILDELTISNVSEILFTLVPSYDELKEAVLYFMAKNFPVVHSSQEFKGISEKFKTVIEYKKYNITLSEILTEFFKN